VSSKGEGFEEGLEEVKWVKEEIKGTKGEVLEFIRDF